MSWSDFVQIFEKEPCLSSLMTLMPDDVLKEDLWDALVDKLEIQNGDLVFKSHEEMFHAGIRLSDKFAEEAILTLTTILRVFVKHGTERKPEATEAAKGDTETTKPYIQCDASMSEAENSDAESV